MATQYLRSDARNPQIAGSYKSAVAPVAGDTVYFNDGDTRIDTNLGWSGIDLLKLVIGPAKGGDVGSSTAPLEVVVDQVSTGQLQILGRGQQYYISGGGAANEITEIQFRPSAGGQLILISCTNLDSSLELGSSVIETTVTLRNVFVGGEHFGHIKPHSSDLVALLVVSGKGQCLLERDYTIARVAESGTIYHDLTEPAAVAGGTLEMYGGRLVLIRGAMAVLNAYAGEIDATQLKEDITPVDGEIYPGVTIKRLRNGPQLILSGVDLKYGGPKFVDV